jgi:hypothetical protein
MSIISNIQPKRLQELINEVMAELNAEGIENAVRREKCVLIEDLFRVKKLLSCKNPGHLADITINAPETFDEYYDLELEQLSIKLAMLSVCLSRYMQAQVLSHNRGETI